MPFGIADAPAVQRKMMEFLLASIKWVSALAYLDDSVVDSAAFSEHLSHLESLFKQRKESVLQLKLDKCALCKSETAYLSFIVSDEGVKQNPAETEPIILCQKIARLCDRSQPLVVFIGALLKTMCGLLISGLF